jgi:hypothetical protein
MSVRRRDRVVSWLSSPGRRGSLTIAIVVIVGAGVIGGVTIRANQAESTARRVAAGVAYRNAINACEREIPVREATRSNAQATQFAFNVLDGFFKGARRRAYAQSIDPKISKLSRVGARKSLVSIDHAIAAFAANLTIPPPPLPCDQVISDPNHPAAKPHHS